MLTDIWRLMFIKFVVQIDLYFLPATLPGCKATRVSHLAARLGPILVPIWAPSGTLIDFAGWVV